MLKKILLGLGLVAVATVPAQADLIISEIVDGTLPGGVPKFVELTNTGATSIDLSNYSIGNYNNGGTTLGGGVTLQLSGTLGSCESYVVSYENSDSPGVSFFFDVYGFDADNLDNGAFINGDDVVALFQGVATGDGSDATLVDVYGVIGVDGSGEAWEYTDGYAHRLVNTASPVFNAAEWFFSGANGLEDVDDAAETVNLQTMTDPGLYTNCSPVSNDPTSFGDLKTKF